MIVNNPAAARNADAIFAVLKPELARLESRAQSKPLRVLEIASGPGQHVEAFAGLCPEVLWQPSEPRAQLRDSIDERVRLAGLDNVARALDLDVCGKWPEQTFDLIMAVNLLHIAPWQVTLALMAGASNILHKRGTLMLYGPYSDRGAHNSRGNLEFDADLRARNPQWGIRNLEEVAQQGAAVGFAELRVVDMPANNRTLFFNREAI